MQNIQRKNDDVGEVSLALILSAVLFAIVVCFIPVTPVMGQLADQTPPALQQVKVEEHLGQTIPLDLHFKDQNGRPVTLEQYFHQGKPVLLTMVYYDCPMLCPMVLNGLRQSVDSLAWAPGDEFQMVSVSFNPRETPALARAKHDLYVNSLRQPVDDNSWAFLVGDESQSKALAQALGFQYHYVPEKQMYAHPAVSYVLTEDGKITRYLYGINHRKRDLKLALLEGAQGKIGNTMDRLLLYCYQYDSDAGGYVLFAENLMRLGGAVTVVILGSVIGRYWWKETHKHAEQSEA